jgi:hypothetical protein
MVKRTDKAFEDWLDETMVGNESRRQFAENRGVSLDDLRWAFGGGWIRGQQQAVKDLQNV